jgi:hypothetical protein
MKNNISLIKKIQKGGFFKEIALDQGKVEFPDGISMLVNQGFYLESLVQQRFA